MSQAHTQQQHHRRHRHHHRRRVWPWVVGVLTVVVLILAIAGVVGLQLVKQAKQVQAHENNAIAMLSKLSSGDAETLANAGDALPQIAHETRQAVDIAHGGLWNAAAKMPFIGTDIATVQGMTTTIDGIVQDSIPQFVDVLKTLSDAQIANGDDGVNLQPIIDAVEPLKQANASFQRQVRDYDALPTPGIGMIRSAYSKGETQLNDLADRVNALSNTFQILPTLLGDGQQRTYAVMAMTPSEMRSSGGLIGSVGELTASNGAVHIGDFRPNGDYLPYGIGDHSEDMKRVFTDEGPLHMSFDIRDLAVFPNTADSAVAMRSIWNRAPWGHDAPLDGVIMVDPVFLQQLIAINGNVTLPDGTVLTGDNTAEFLMNTVYQKYPESETDALFGVVASQAMKSMFSHMSMGKLYKTGEMLGTMAKGRHFTMYAFDERVEQGIQAAGFTGQIPSSETNPSVGIYLTEQNPSKMGWYIKRKAKIQRVNCDDGDLYHVEFMVHNTMTEEEAKSLPWYITGNNSNNTGKAMEKILFYAPQGGSISNLMQLGGKVDAAKETTIDGVKAYETYVQVNPGQIATFTFDVRVSPKATAPLTIDQTPMGWVDDGITYLDPKCDTK
ncbi:chemotaxis protein [Bifidobacterium pseudolongum subsp. globosum]|nr:chemotaxis protein [Bifidobacterium pseudolongum subsp. globosum]